MVICSDSDNSEWDWDVDDDVAEILSSPAPRNHPDAPSPSTWARQAAAAGGRAINGAASLSYPIEDFVAMGFSQELVLKGIENIGKTSGNGHGDPHQLVDLLLTLQALDEGCFPGGNPSTSGSAPQIVEDEVDSEGWDDEEEDFPQETSQMDHKIKCLLAMGFLEDEAKMAITRCGLYSPMSVLIDSIHASQAIGDEHETMGNNCIDSSLERKEAKKPIWGSRKKRRKVDGGGPPFFYFENATPAQDGFWDTISRCLYGIKPEFVDSRLFSAATRESGYVHNLPVDNRFVVLPPPPKTIFEAFPYYAEWWPSWDPRRRLSCLGNCPASAASVKRIRCELEKDPCNPPAETVRRYVLNECRSWDLVWVGQNRVASLEPDEMELLLGYPKNHTRGPTRTDRYRSLANVPG